MTEHFYLDDPNLPNSNFSMFFIDMLCFLLFRGNDGFVNLFYIVRWLYKLVCLVQFSKSITQIQKFGLRENDQDLMVF